MADENNAAAPVLTDEEKQQELEGRIKSFNDELIPILGKYELGLGATAFVAPNGTIGARPILFDARKQPGEEAPAEGQAEAPEAPAATAA